MGNQNAVGISWYFAQVVTGPLPQKPWVTIGNFDGCHKGHQLLFQEVVSQSADGAVGITFFPHPQEIFSHTPMQYLDMLPFRIHKMLASGMRYVGVVHFTEAFSQTPWDTFLEMCLLQSGFTAAGVCVGQDFVFGKNREGNPERLKGWLSQHHMGYAILDSVSVEWRKISSSWAREALAQGDCTTMHQMLGCDYAIGGVVWEGRRLGRKLGFPTANIYPPQTQLLPAFGVYAATTTWRGKRYPSVVNIGIRPTIDATDRVPVVESHLLDFDQEIYGDYVEVRPLEHFRGEQKFPDIAALSAQIQQDVVRARQVFGV